MIPETGSVVENTTPSRAAEQNTTEETASENSQGLSLRIAIDPGHGFGDNGSGSLYLPQYEQYYTMLIANSLKEKLEGYGAQVVLTHDGDSYPSEDELYSKGKNYGIFDKYPLLANGIEYNDNLFNKYERMICANALYAENEFDLYVSIHLNSYEEDDSVCGTEIYYCNTNTFASKIKSVFTPFCEEVQSGGISKYASLVGTDFNESYVSTKYCQFASVLVECAYMSNPDEAKNIAGSEWRDKFTSMLAATIVEGFN